MTLRDALLAAGFVPTRYEGQEGEFLLKTLRVEDMPYAREHMVDGDYICASMKAHVELTPDNRVQFFIPDADYVEGPVPAESEEGVALLADAGFKREGVSA